MVTLVLVLLAVVVVLVYAREPVEAWRRYRGTRLVTCPETRQPAAVSVDVPHAALTALVDDKAGLRLASCSRWEERGPCREPCLAEVQTSGAAGTVRALAERWFASRACAYCGKPIADVTAAHHEPALRRQDGSTVQWPDVPQEQLPAMFATHAPVCWNCHLAESFIRDHPEMVTGRS
jgi:hypothetical protein